MVDSRASEGEGSCKECGIAAERAAEARKGEEGTALHGPIGGPPLAPITVNPVPSYPDCIATRLASLIGSPSATSGNMAIWVAAAPGVRCSPAKWPTDRKQPAAAAALPIWGAAAACRRLRLRPAVILTASSSSTPGGSLQPSDLDRMLYTDEVPLTRLQRELDAAVEGEDYELAAQLRDVLQ